MSAPEPMRPADQAARDRFRSEWRTNFAVSANAGSGKTTAISERLATLALATEAADVLPKTAVVTFTRKAAAQIGQRARSVLIRRLAAEGRRDLAPLDHLERAFFGTIHSFCLLLAQRHGQAVGINLNPTVVEAEDRAEALWEEFIEADPMRFSSLGAAPMDAFLRHVPLETIFPLARQLDRATAERLAASPPVGPAPAPAAAALEAILAATSRGKGAEALRRNQVHLRDWCRRYREETGFLPIARPEGTAGNIEDLCAQLYGPLKAWLAAAGASLAGELALRFRAWRFERGVQTYADQVEGALAILQDRGLLDRLRAEGWRIVLDEAQDTDPQQFAVLVELARPPGSALGTWPDAGGAGPRAGHFSMVGDGQQSIYGSRADVRNFQRHLAAFARGDGGELLRFDVTFRSPRRLIELLNATLPAAFGSGRDHNCGLPPAPGAPAPLLQVEYEPLVAAAASPAGAVLVLPVSPAADRNVDPRLAHEAREVAAWLARHGPGAVGARRWGDICLLAPRNDWLVTARKELDAAGLRSALQMRRTRSGDNPPYAWLAGLLTAVCDPENTFEWVGVLREIFTIADGALAEEVRRGALQWDEPAAHPEPIAAALAVLEPFVERVDAEGEPLEVFAQDLVSATGLRHKARQIDGGGAFELELDRLLAEAAALGAAGAGPREWRAALIEGLEAGRPSGQPADDAINLLTSQSAKGLEWPVVIPIGLWREIRRPEERGLQLVAELGGCRAYMDAASMPDATREARDREWRREQVRLLYVTLTRARRALVLPRGEAADRGSFLDYWGADLSGLDQAEPGRMPEDRGSPPPANTGPVDLPRIRLSGLTYPQRVLPHQLAAGATDVVRRNRHETGSEEPRPSGSADPLEYGTWWHETMEFLPWRGHAEAVNSFLAERREQAAVAGFGVRAGAELQLLIDSEAWASLRGGEWQILTEVSVVAPLQTGNSWVDGVIDLVAYDQSAKQVLVVDWKTNRPAGDRDAFLAKLRGEYAGQVEAYRVCLAGFFPGCAVQVALHATGLGAWVRW
ncbi:MAG TPA: UvrD-helicase domain-containing protein [Opitutaceae bacterium]|nr:UvrD-helicase domain-containing protein [Opitutaceae bacterium]